jgi:hypothetical protein
VNRITVALALLLALSGAAPAQDAPVPPVQGPAPAPAPKKPPANDIFSGTVTELTSDSVTVLRTALARESVKRTFVLDSRTVVEGKLRAKARVSVRYMADDSGVFHALHIIVR